MIMDNATAREMFSFIATKALSDNEMIFTDCMNITHVTVDADSGDIAFKQIPLKDFYRPLKGKEFERSL